MKSGLPQPDRASLLASAGGARDTHAARETTAAGASFFAFLSHITRSWHKGRITNRIFLYQRKKIFYCILLQSKRVKDEQILEKDSRESDSQKGLGLNSKSVILKILSSFTRFECRML